jgi:histone H3/H4
MVKENLLVVRSKIKEGAYYNGKRLHVSSDFAEILSEQVNLLIRNACRRAQENGRTTVMGRDL